MSLVAYVQGAILLKTVQGLEAQPQKIVSKGQDSAVGDAVVDVSLIGALKIVVPSCVALKVKLSKEMWQ
jgi:hypothetical protein